eukprot:TRINITY_DN9818_c0_g1_i3.p1 TRINITY_DN9818_c0_g1~~TRINITY_DN9818_c0_g1_i3.p1  ORF type:complete len:159 (+),score=51.96 TRINITY_DN9818_c0_g1_i3:95-571(+)
MNPCLVDFRLFFFLMIRRPPRSTHCISSAASDVYKRQYQRRVHGMAQGSFNVVLQNTAKTLYDIDLQINRYGKPYDAAFQYMKKKAQELTNLEISNYYLIGDNPQSDILGANNNGFDSILVKTGVYQSDQNCSEIPGKYFVEDITAAVNLILKIEQII